MDFEDKKTVTALGFTFEELTELRNFLNESGLCIHDALVVLDRVKMVPSHRAPCEICQVRKHKTDQMWGVVEEFYKK